jgi:hypothetical protein
MIRVLSKIIATSAVVLVSSAATAATQHIQLYAENRVLLHSSGGSNSYAGSSFAPRLPFSSSREHVFMIRNSGAFNAPDLNLFAPLAISGIDASQFSIIHQPEKTTLKPFEDTTFSVMYHPTAVKSHASTIAISSNDPIQPTFFFDLSGSCVAQLDPRPDFVLLPPTSRPQKYNAKTDTYKYSGRVLAYNLGPVPTEPTEMFTWAGNKFVLDDTALLLAPGLIKPMKAFHNGVPGRTRARFKISYPAGYGNFFFGTTEVPDEDFTDNLTVIDFI